MKQLSKYKVFVADKIHPEGLRSLKRAGFKVIECFGMSNGRLLDAINKSTSAKDSGSCLIVRSFRRISKTEIDALNDLSFSLICTASSGFDNVDVKYCRKRGIRVLNVPFGNYVSAAEHTVAMILSILKNLVTADGDVRNGVFDEKKYTNFEFSGKKIGLVGVGRVGSHVARISKAFGAEVIGNDIKRTLRHRYKWIIFKALDDLLKEADIISIHTPLNESTLNLIDARRLSLLKPNAILINCARGGIVDEEELIRILRARKIHYAGIDVFQNEPFINRRFGGLSNVILSPHIAGKTVESRKRISVQLAAGIVEYYSRKR